MKSGRRSDKQPGTFTRGDLESTDRGRSIERGQHWQSHLILHWKRQAHMQESRESDEADLGD